MNAVCNLWLFVVCFPVGQAFQPDEQTVKPESGSRTGMEHKQGWSVGRTTAAPPAFADQAQLPPAEFGHALTPQQAAAGWISLFDGKSTFGWRSAMVSAGQLRGGRTTSEFGPHELIVEAGAGGVIVICGEKRQIPAGKSSHMSIRRHGPIELGADVSIRSMILRPTGLKSLLNGKDLGAWKRIDRDRIPLDKRPTWQVVNGAIRAVGGPGALEYPESFGDFLLQLDVCTLAPIVNGGLFFRCIPGDFMNGYEAQIYNRCEDNDPAKPSTYSTGSLDDRQLARRLVSRDGETFRMTVVASGPHIATWVNGYQLIDWTDTRAKHVNPRQGLRTDPGVIQLQAHDPETNLEFRGIFIAPLP